MSNRRFEMFEIRTVPVRLRRGDSDRAVARAGLMGVAVGTPVARRPPHRSVIPETGLFRNPDSSHCCIGLCM